VWQCLGSDPHPDWDMKCNPNITQEVTHATSGSDYNRFYLRAWDANPAQYCGIFANMSRQDFWQCSGVDCATYVDCNANPCNSSCWTDPNAEPPACRTSPVVIDVSGNGFNLTTAAGGVLFDISGTNHPVQMGWTAANSNNAFLVLPGGDGLVHNGKQLFGNFTPQPASKTPNGFAALAVYDDSKSGGNGDGIIDSRDAVFSSLRLWIDTNHDGISQPDELHTLPSMGVTSISLNYKADRRTDQYGNVFRYRAQVNPGETTTTGRMAYDVFFVTSSPTSRNTPRSLIPRSLIPADGHKCWVPIPIRAGILSTLR